MFRKVLLVVPALSAALIGGLVLTALVQNPPPEQDTSVPVATIEESLLYTFNSDGILNETAASEPARSPYWWLDSGGELIIEDGVGKTIQGALRQEDPWYKEYAATNPTDTDGGKYPQNIFRLVSRSSWDNVRLEASFWVKRDNLVDSPNRNESNGLLLMSRYVDGDTLYYAGIRVDGTAVIKKKYKGVYYTMAQKKIFSGTYDREDMPDLLPSDGWIRLRGETITLADGSVRVELFMQDETPDHWTLLVSADDDSQYADTPPIVGEYRVGIRTDFMDVYFDDVLMERL
jgi:hypothetical protein